MAPNAERLPVVLVVDDEREVADTYALQLDGEYETRVAYGGYEALEKLDDEVDAVLLDRRMPDLHGDDVLAAIRDRGYDCPVIMATAVDPDLNILEMEFDDYLCKPIFRQTLVETLDNHLGRMTPETAGMQEYLAILSKIDVLETELSQADPAEHEEYRRLQDRAEELAPRLRDAVDDFDEMVETYREIERGR